MEPMMPSVSTPGFSKAAPVLTKADASTTKALQRNLALSRAVRSSQSLMRSWPVFSARASVSSVFVARPVAAVAIATAAAAAGFTKRRRREHVRGHRSHLVGHVCSRGATAVDGRQGPELPRASVVRHAAAAEVVSGFVTACSTANKWEQAIDEVVEAAGKTEYECGIAFIHELHVTMAQGMAPVLGALREKLGVRTLIGCAVSGAIGQAAGPSAVEYGGLGGDGTDRPPIEVEGGYVLSIGLLREATATPFFLGSGATGDLELLNRKAAEGSVRSILTIADPFGPIESILKSLDESFPGVVKAGGLSTPLQVGSAERQAFMPSMAIASAGCDVRVLDQGICGILLEDVDVHTIVCQGCCGAGPAVTVSSVSGQVLDGIGGRPANESLRLIFSSVEPEMREKMQKFLVLGLGNAGESERSLGDGDWLIRMISGVTPQGGLVVGDSLAVGQPMRFHVRDKATAEADLALMLKRYRLEKSFWGSPGGDPMGAFLFTCNGRGEGLYGRRHVDARAAVEALGDACGARVAGFFCNGEIGSPGLAIPLGSAEEDAPKKRGTALHGFTAVFAILVPTAKSN